ncbi:signal recognition particle, SRP19 subunit [Gongronella butleri]|nr:signal recognition particle, SRP19 subunit [Gongronella butleri]
MSMLNNLKKTQKNAVFLDDDDDMDIDNMDFPLPTDADMASSSSTSSSAQQQQQAMADLQRRMQQMSTNTPTSHVTVASGPNGAVRRMDPSEYKDWVCVYPCYLDLEKSVNEGRKIVKEKAVKAPHAYHMAVAVQQLGLNVVYESKRHPRDWANPGRVRVEMKGPNSFYRNANITSRKELFYAIAARLPEVQKQQDIPKGIVSPMTSLAEVEALADEQRKAQGLPTLAELKAQDAAHQAAAQRNMPPKKQKVKYVRG